MLACGASAFDYYQGYQESWIDNIYRFEQTEAVYNNLNGLHMFIILLQEKVLQNEQEISELQSIIWKLEKENFSLQERIHRLEATLTELWQNNTNYSSNDCGAYSEMSSELYDDQDPSDIMDSKNGIYPPDCWISAPPEFIFPNYDLLSSQLYWSSSQPVMCYFYGVPTMPGTFMNYELMHLNGQDNISSASYYYTNNYDM